MRTNSKRPFVHHISSEDDCAVGGHRSDPLRTNSNMSVRPIRVSTRIRQANMLVLLPGCLEGGSCFNLQFLTHTHLTQDQARCGKKDLVNVWPFSL